MVNIVEILVACSQKSLCMILRRACDSSRDPGQLSKRSLHDLVQVLVRRSCSDPAENIVKRYLQ